MGLQVLSTGDLATLSNVLITMLKEKSDKTLREKQLSIAADVILATDNAIETILFNRY